ncbi:methyl-accepting chemotaxis protein [Desulfococcaceae bacterium HSG8]|nr:methyl-accepting chemotaxis protein [Desulfococcaceae bacterium HSG8]
MIIPRLKNIRMKLKLTALFLLACIVPIVSLGLWSSRLATNALIARSFGQLESVRDIKKEQIRTFFAERKGDMGVLVETVDSFRKSAFERLQTVQELKKHRLKTFFAKLQSDILTLSKSEDVFKLYGYVKTYHDDMMFSPSDPYDTSTDGYKKLWSEHSTHMKDYAKVYGYYDVFLICASHGHVMFTVAKESDLGTNLGHGPHKDEGLARLWRRVTESGKVVFEDFSSYTPSEGQHSAFIGAPVYDSSDKLVAVVALQIPTDPINAIVQRRQSMGKTGMTYLVGRKDNITSYRSNKVVKKGEETPGEGKIGDAISGNDIDKAIAGKSGQEIKTSNAGDLEIVSYAPLKIPGINWAIISTIKLEEAIVPKGEEEEEEDFFGVYIKKSGYHDLFLIHPEGKVFYSVTNEADYGTNMINGEYAKSGLGKLVREVLKTGQFGMADFEPYPPSNNDPASFIAQPVRQNDKVQLIVALRLSLEAINSIMQQREGMGTTGETYLVGHDKLMRSDSFMDPILHSVKASFANPSGGSVDTEAVSEALSGKTASKIIKDYRGSQSLSSFTKLDVGDMSWALLAEIDKTEVEEPVRELIFAIVYGGLFILSVIAVFASFIAKQIADPLVKSADFTKSMSMGDFSAEIDIKQKDEIGLLADSLREMEGKISDVLKALDTQILAVQEGNLGIRSDAESFSGGWHELIVKINDLIATLVGHIDNIPNPSLIIDKDFTIRYISKAGADIIGREAEDLVGEKCYDHLKTSDCRTPNCACARAMRSGRNERGETDAHPAATDLFISYSAVPLKSQEGEIIGVMDAIVDQTAVRKAMESAGETAAVLIDSVQNLSSSSQEISSTSNEQAAAVKEIVSTMEDSDQLAKSIAAKINEVTEAASTSKDVVNKGFSIIKNTLAKIIEIKDSNLETITEIKSLGDRIESIWDIVNMINGIADQTKIIAFNAELEASSAGDAGKNFQIVASEIRRLADSTVSSTGEIKSKIGEIQNSSDKLIIASEDGTEKITEGWKLSERLQSIFEEILSSSEVSADSAGQIAVSINQQVSAFEQILLTLKQIAEGIDSFVVSTKATTEASEKLGKMADMLHAVIEEYASKDGSEDGSEVKNG